MPLQFVSAAIRVGVQPHEVLRQSLTILRTVNVKK